MELVFSQIYLYFSKLSAVSHHLPEQSCFIVPKQGIENVKVILTEEMLKWNIEGYRKADIVCTDWEKQEFYLRSSDLEVVEISDMTALSLSQNENHVKKTLLDYKKYLNKEIAKKNSQINTSLSIPTIPKDVFIDDIDWSLMCSCVKLGKYPLLLGPKGCGKTTIAAALAKSLEMDFFSINGGGISKPKQTLVGMLQVKENSNGSVETVLIESEFLKFYKSDNPTLIFIDELTRAPQQAVNYLMTILDRTNSYIYVEELGCRVSKGKGVMFVCAGNVGIQYTDTRTMDAAIKDRFTKFLVSYLPELQECSLLQSRAPLAQFTDIKRLVEFVAKTRLAETNKDISSGLSTRQLIDAVEFLQVGYDLRVVVNNILLTNYTEDELEHVKSLMQQF